MKCAHCRSRKGKRRCPVLLAKICPSCCAALRGEPRRRCPRECPYYAPSEMYQRRRRLEKLRAQGRPYVEERVRVFPREEEREAAGEIEHVIYRWSRCQRGLTDEAAAEAYEGLRRVRGAIALARDLPNPLVRFLSEVVRRLPRCAALAPDRLDAVLERLAGLAREAGDGGSPRAYLDGLAGYHEFADGPEVKIPGGKGERPGGSSLILPS